MSEPAKKERPTEKAHFHFNGVGNFALAAKTKRINNPDWLAEAMCELAKGLNAMNTGLRATYLLLEEVKALLLKAQGPAGNAPGGVSLRDR